MKVLIDIERFAHIEDEVELKKELFSYIESVYYNTDGVPEDTYLYEEAPEEMDVVFGSDHPDEIIALAENWNQTLVNEYKNAVTKLAEEISDENVPRNKLSNYLTYGVKTAVMAIDNTFYAYSDYAVLPKSQDWFSTLIDDDVLRDIRQNPEYYATVEVWPK